MALSLATFMNVLDSSIANVSLPAIAGDLGVSPTQGTWVITSFGVANAISVPLGSNDSGVFWFFNPANFEVLIKVINACGFNNRYWVFMAATTNVGFTVNVRDQVTGITYTRTNPLGTNTITDLTDTNALATCP